MKNIQLFLQSLAIRSSILLCVITLNNTHTSAQNTGGVLVEVQKICVYCGGAGNKFCSSCQGVGSKTYNRYRYTANGMVMEPEKIPCTLCPGNGRVKCEFCSGTGLKKDWEYKSETVAQSPKTTSSATNATKSEREQAAKKRFFAISKTKGWSGKAFDKYSDKFKTGYKMTLLTGATDNVIMADYPAFPCSSHLKLVKSEETSTDNYTFRFQESLQTHKDNCADGLTVYIYYNRADESAIEIKYYHPTLGLVSYGTLYPIGSR